MAIKFKVGATVRQADAGADPGHGHRGASSGATRSSISVLESIDAEGNRTARFFSEDRYRGG